MRKNQIETEDGTFLRIIKECKTCRDPFSYSQEEETWLKSRGLAPFERCPNCRKKRRLAANAREIEEAINNGQ